MLKRLPVRLPHIVPAAFLLLTGCAVVPVPDEAAAIAAANESDYGLGAAIFTRDVARGERLAVSEIQAGSCFVNAFVKSDPRLPFGGIRNSGYGRELSHYGLREFVNIKTVWVQ